MNSKIHLLIFFLALGISSCASFKTGKDRVVPDLRVQLKVSSLHAKQIQEQGVLGTQDGDELTLIYTLNAYDEKGNLLSVNNGFWGTRTIGQNALILADEFNKIAVEIPKSGKVIAALTLIEVDDYKGERKMAKIKPHTNRIQYPKYLSITNFDEDQNLAPLQLVANALKIAGYKNFQSRQLNLSINDDMGGTKQALDTADLTKIMTGARSGKETYEIDGSQVNEKYLYVLKYDLDVSRISQ